MPMAKTSFQMQYRKLEEVKEQLRFASSHCEQYRSLVLAHYQGTETMYILTALDQALEDINRLRNQCLALQDILHANSLKLEDQ